MNYPEALDYLYSRLPMFTRDGASAFKKDLTNTLALCQHLGNPQDTYPSIHIAGTNGKGSSSHMLAAILQTAGYKTGLYTSPHLLDFRERIKVNGQMATQAFVTDFVQKHQSLIEQIQPSFFEVTVAMAFSYFAEKEVDLAIIETGLGGRLDSTNIIHPILTLITNIGYDHMNMLGNSLEEIAGEKAGIIKAHVPSIISERQPATDSVFQERSRQLEAPLTFASDFWKINRKQLDTDYQYLTLQSVTSSQEMLLALDLKGSYQQKNLAGVLSTIDLLHKRGYHITEDHIREGLRQVQRLTGLMGRWQTLGTAPLTICDTGHNEDGWKEVLHNIHLTPHKKLHIVLGVMRDKDLAHMLTILPKEAEYYFCHPDFERALPAVQLQEQAREFHLSGQAYPSIPEAIQAAQTTASPEDMIFIGGSTFVVAEALPVFGY